MNAICFPKTSISISRRLSVQIPITLLAGAVFGTLPAFGQFAGFSSYTSPTTPMSWSTPSGNIGVTFGISVSPNTFGVGITPNAVGQINPQYVPVNPAFTSLFPMASYQNLNIFQNGGAVTFPVTETLTFQYSSPVNFASSLIFLDIGGSEGPTPFFDGPMIGTISATLGGAPVSTSTWQFNAFEDQNNGQSVSYTWNAAAGQFDVPQFVSSIAGILTSDANTPFDALTISYQTASFDQYGLAQYALPTPEPSTWGLLAAGVFFICGARMRGMRRGKV